MESKWLKNLKEKAEKAVIKGKEVAKDIKESEKFQKVAEKTS